MIRALGEDERGLVDLAREFRRHHVRDAAAGWERERRSPLEAFRAAADCGLLHLDVPKSHGGHAVAYLVKLRVCEELARDCMAFAFAMINTHNFAARLARVGPPRLVDAYLEDLMAARRFGATAITEPDAGSDVGALRTTATKVADGWRIDGAKAWITNAAIADLFLVYAQSDPALGWRGIASFIVDGRRDGFTREAPYGMAGGHALGAGGFRLDGYIAAEDEMLAPPGEAFRRAIEGINGARVYVAGMCCGMLRAALAHAVDYAGAREAFGRPLLAHQGLGWLLADVASDLEAAQLMTDAAAMAIEAGENAEIASAHAKKFAARIASARIADCIEAMGANGLRDDVPLGRHLACAKIAHFVDGTTEIQNERIHRVLATHYGGAG